MKKVVLGMLLCATIGFAQTKKSNAMKQSDSIHTETPYVPYISVGLSFTNGDDFKKDSYPSVEIGITKGNISFGLALGRGNLYFEQDNISNYFYEPKVTGSLPIGKLYGTLVFGIGGYIDTPHTFIEYGSGLGYTDGNISYSITYSNWDKVDYITPCITYTFN